MSDRVSLGMSDPADTTGGRADTESDLDTDDVTERHIGRRRISGQAGTGVTTDDVTEAIHAENAPHHAAGRHDAEQPLASRRRESIPDGVRHRGGGGR